MVLVLLAGVRLGLLATNGKSHAVFRLAPLKSKSKWKLEDGDESCGVDGLETEGDAQKPNCGLKRCSSLVASRHSEDGSPSVVGRCPGGLCSSVPQFLMMAGSRLRVCRKRLLDKALAAGDELEKTLFSIPCADISAA